MGNLSGAGSSGARSSGTDSRRAALGGQAGNCTGSRGCGVRGALATLMGLAVLAAALGFTESSWLLEQSWKLSNGNASNTGRVSDLAREIGTNVGGAVGERRNVGESRNAERARDHNLRLTAAGRSEQPAHSEEGTAPDEVLLAKVVDRKVVDHKAVVRPLAATFFVARPPAAGDLATVRLVDGRLLVVRVLGEAPAREGACASAKRARSEQELLTCRQPSEGTQTLWKAPSAPEPKASEGSL